MYPTTEQAEHGRAKGELDDAIEKLKGEAASLERAIKDGRIPARTRKRARLLNLTGAGVVLVGGFTGLLIPAAYLGFRIQVLSPLWYLWPVHSQMEDFVKLVIILVVTFGIAAVLRLVRRQTLRAAVKRLDEGIAAL